MTERNFTEVVPGWYRTRVGELAEVVQIMDARLKSGHPAWGLLHTISFNWTMDGLCYYPGREEPADLIEFLGAEKPREKKKMVKKAISIWANVSKRNNVSTHATKKQADDEYDDSRTACDRVACIELTGEYEIEEEV